MHTHVSPSDLLRAGVSPLSAASTSNRVKTCLLAVAVLSLAIPTVMLGGHLWSEWSALMADEEAAASAGVVGFPNIYPAVNRATPPEPWRREGSDVLVWSGWKSGVGHGWFRLAADECDPSSIGNPVGRDVARAIDHPAVEHIGGDIWGRLPRAFEVAGFLAGTTPCAYPRMVLSKVLVVNDVIAGVPYLVYHDPFDNGQDGDVSVYAPLVEGKRITMGCSGFCIDRKLVLYDRGTESLWRRDGSALASFSGKLKGKRLPLLQRAGTSSWGDWVADNPGSRLIVGSLDRGLGVPAE